MRIILSQAILEKKSNFQQLRENKVVQKLRVSNKVGLLIQYKSKK
mgnify:CR=1 FL=1